MISIKLKGAAKALKSLRQCIEVRTEDAKWWHLYWMQRDLREATPVDTGEAREGWEVTKDGHLSNQVDHIVYLNQGHSSQAPAHFIERVLSGYKGVVSKGSIVTYK